MNKRREMKVVQEQKKQKRGKVADRFQWFLRDLKQKLELI